jgi:succinoglycan biosynthesis protein ExoO
MVADDLILFDHAAEFAPHRFLKETGSGEGRWIGLADYLGQTRMHSRHPNLGFLKPMWRRSWLEQHGLRYDPRLRIAEDDDLCLRALLAGARYRLLPTPLYFYRKHGASISHRLSTDHSDRMVAAIGRLDPAFADQPAAVRSAWAKRGASIRQAGAFTHLIEALKQRSPAAFLRGALTTPSALLLFRQPVGARLSRLIPRRRHRDGPSLSRKDVVFISRQRLTGANNGSLFCYQGLCTQFFRSSKQ